MSGGSRMTAAMAELAAQAETAPAYREFGARVTSLGDGQAQLVVRRDEVRLRGVRDSLNGGVVASLAAAVARLCLRAELTGGQHAGRVSEIDIAYLSGARGSTTLFDALMLRKGGRVAVCEVEVRDGNDGTLNAKARVSIDIV